MTPRKELLSVQTFQRIVSQSIVRVGLKYAKKECTKTEFDCVMGYFKILQKRVRKHYLRLYERN